MTAADPKQVEKALPASNGLAQLELPLSNWRLNDYDEIAPAFNAAMGNDFAEIIFPATLRFVRQSLGCGNLGKIRHLDIACGTGVFLLKLAKAMVTEGTGIDLSKGQIQQARLGAARAGVRATFQVGDIVAVPFPERCDLVTCNMDALNHIHHLRDWQKVFRKVRGCLRDGGIFLFDVNTARRIVSDLARPGIIIKRDLTYLHYVFPLERAGEAVRRKMLMQAFIASGNTYKRTCALVEHTAVPNNVLFRMLDAAGFSQIGLRKMDHRLLSKHIFMRNRAFVMARV